MSPHVTNRSSFPLSALSVPFLQYGSFDSVVDGSVHTKTTPYAIIVQPREGWYTVVCRGETVTAYPGDTVFIPAQTTVTFVHHAGRTKPMASRWVHVNWVLFNSIDLSSLYDIPLKLGTKATAQLEPVIGELRDIQLTPDDKPLLNLVRQFELGLAILRCVISCATSCADINSRINLTEKFRGVIEHMNAHLPDQLTAAQLARIQCVSPSRFFTLFKNHFGQSPMAYVRQLRLAEACRLLIATDKSIARVAMECGCINQFHFSRIFKESFGVSPREYRKRKY